VKINLVLVQNLLLLIIGLSINWMAFLILDFILQYGFTALFNFATIYPLLGFPILSGAIIALRSFVVAALLKKD
jgi:hypothetical protein